MKPDWDKLMTKFADDPVRLIADVDCTAKGQPLCETHGIRGYPSIKHGDPAALEDYNGGRSYKDLETFASGLKPLCSPMNLDLCSDDEKSKIEELQALSSSDLDAKIKEEEEKISEAEKFFKEEVEKLQKKYTELDKEKEEKIKAVKDGGLGIMKSVQVASKKKKEEL